MSTPRPLGPIERQLYDTLGYVVVPDVFSPDECRAIDDEIDRILEGLGRRVADDRGNGFLMQLGLQSALTRRICADDRLLTLIEDIVRPGIAIYSAKMVPKYPGRGRGCAWHQDNSYYNQLVGSATRMSIWLALHDSDAGNGGVHFLPGSHRWGPRPWRRRDDSDCALEVAEIADVHRRHAVCPAVPAGAAILFSANTWHYSDVNRSDRIRRAFIVSYQEATVPGGNGEQWTVLRPAPAVEAERA